MLTRILNVSFILCLASTAYAQNIEQLFQNHACIIKTLQSGDSIAYYQCHVEDATQQMVTASGQTITGKTQAYTITEKFVVTKKDSNYFVSYYTSSVNVFPNKKFSGLKIREKTDWHFKRDTTFALSLYQAKLMIGIENKGREAVEYDYPVTKYTTNQLIIKYRKNFKQLVIEGPYVLSALFFKK